MRSSVSSSVMPGSSEGSSGDVWCIITDGISPGYQKGKPGSIPNIPIQEMTDVNQCEFSPCWTPQQRENIPSANGGVLTDLYGVPMGY